MFTFVLQGEHSAAFEQKVTGGNTFMLVKFDSFLHHAMHSVEGIQVRYRKSPRYTCRTVKLKLTLTLTLTLTDTGGAVLTLMLGYRSLYTLHGNSDF